MATEIKQPPSIAETRQQSIGCLAREKLYQEIEAERAYQDAKWGGPDHDDYLESNASFASYIAEYACGISERAIRHNWRTRFVKAAALAVAAIERFDRLADRQRQLEEDRKEQRSTTL